MRRAAGSVPKLAVSTVQFRQSTMMVAGQPQFRSYYKNNVLMNREYGDGYMSCPVATGERIVRLIALHDALCVPASEITLGKSFGEIGLNALDMVEVYLMLEKEFDFEISEEDCESFTTINDVVEHTSRNFYAKWNKKQEFIFI